MSFEFSELLVETRTGPRRALVMAPDQDYRVGLEELEALRTSGRQSPIDEALVAQIQQRDDYRVIIFRGVSDAGHRWTLDPTLSESDANELAKRLTLSQLTTWRQVLGHGVWVLVHTEFGIWGPAFRDTCRELADELEPNPREPREFHDIDRWILRNLVFFFGQSMSSVTQQVLPRTLPVIENRSNTIEGFVQTMSAMA